jgi:hypothetical protein
MLFGLQGEIMQYEVNEGEDDFCGRKLLNRLRRIQICRLWCQGGRGEGLNPGLGAELR